MKITITMIHSAADKVRSLGLGSLSPTSSCAYGGIACNNEIVPTQALLATYNSVRNTLLENIKIGKFTHGEGHCINFALRQPRSLLRVLGDLGRATNKQFCNPTHDCPACKDYFKVNC